jgi:hypothetical protein
MATNSGKITAIEIQKGPREGSITLDDRRGSSYQYILANEAGAAAL